VKFTAKIELFQIVPKKECISVPRESCKTISEEVCKSKKENQQKGKRFLYKKVNFIFRVWIKDHHREGMFGKAQDCLHEAHDYCWKDCARRDLFKIVCSQDYWDLLPSWAWDCLPRYCQAYVLQSTSDEVYLTISFWKKGVGGCIDVLTWFFV